YEVETRALNQAVKRKRDRFPVDFMFQLTNQEVSHWRSQIVISNPEARMGLRRSPFAFTEHGALMAATVLNSPRAVEMSLYVVRTFVRIREVLATHKTLASKLALSDMFFSAYRLLFTVSGPCALSRPPAGPTHAGDPAAL
ncbi:MAG: ORF6N domain-containing protein, partial [Burkholderiales bacterium]|nr:ORF6N domain-containing protein [Burkholderiales bacterium]